MMHSVYSWQASVLLAACLLALQYSPSAFANTARVSELEARLQQLTRELEAANAELGEARRAAVSAQKRFEEGSQKGNDIKLGPLTVGGAVRVNYVYGDYVKSGDAPQRGGNGGNVELDTFRINASLDHEQIIGKLEYRWYDGYNFMHTAWIGYDFDDRGQIQAGLTRVPFGPGPYGVSKSWFFDQHYYVGLADDMDLGLKYVDQFGNLDLSLAFFFRSEEDWNGASEDSARYGYDAVRWRSAITEDGTLIPSQTNGYDERNQLNLRAIYRFQDIGTDLGISLQAGELDGKRTDDGDHWAASLHMVNQVGDITLATQLTRYEIDIDQDNALGTDELIPMGAYDFAWPVATEAWLPAISLSYTYVTTGIPWLDSVQPYIEYSSIVKDSNLANDSELLMVGAAWASGGWYIYTDYARSNGNLFVGNEGDDFTNAISGVGDFGANGNDRWNYRFNVNFGYYF